MPLDGYAYLHGEGVDLVQFNFGLAPSPFSQFFRLLYNIRSLENNCKNITKKMIKNLAISLNCSILAVNKNAGTRGLAPAFFK